ncbi:MAG: hypothetical protein GYA55_01110, partial [SAR324 cluster bacterium]|nr:hypothetical protein [SAR324 cluster bacterium]
KNLSIAYRYLQAPLRIREGILEKDPKNKLIPLAEIRSAADKCINNIAAILKELEEGKQSSYESDLPYEDYEEDENPEKDNE